MAEHAEDHTPCLRQQEDQGYAQLPHEVLRVIFEHLDPVGLIQVGHVCSAWRKHACSETIWKRVATTRGYNLPRRCLGTCSLARSGEIYNTTEDGDCEPRTGEVVCDCFTWFSLGIRCTLGYLDSPLQVVVSTSTQSDHRAACMASVVEHNAALSGFEILSTTTLAEFSKRDLINHRLPLLVVYVISVRDGETAITALQELTNIAKSELERADGGPTPFQGQHYGVYVTHRGDTGIDADLAKLKAAMRLCGATCMSSHINFEESDRNDRYDCRPVGTDFRNWNRKLWRLCERKRGWPTRRKQLNMNKTIHSADELWSFRAQRLALINRFKARASRRTHKRNFLDVDVYSVSSTIIVIVLCYFVQTRYYASSG